MTFDDETLGGPIGPRPPWWVLVLLALPFVIFMVVAVVILVTT